MTIMIAFYNNNDDNETLYGNDLSISSNNQNFRTDFDKIKWSHNMQLQLSLPQNDAIWC